MRKRSDDGKLATWEGVVEAVAAGISATALTGAIARRLFRRAVKEVVDESIADVLERQKAFETRQGRHLDRQDRKLDRIEALVRTALTEQ